LPERRPVGLGCGAKPPPVASAQMAGEAEALVAIATGARSGAKAIRRFRLPFG